MLAGASYGHPGYSDPDVAYAENMIQASWYLQKAGDAALSEACAMEAVKAFAGADPDRATGRKTLGRASYDPSGILSCTTDSNRQPLIQISAPPFETGLTETALDTEKQKRDMAQFLKTLDKRYHDYTRLGWFAQNQLKGALQNKKPRMAGPGLAQVLESLQKISLAWQSAGGDEVITAACKDAVAKIMAKNPATGPACAYKGMSFNNKKSTSLYTDWYYRLQWLPQEPLDQAASRIDAILYGGQSVFYDILHELNNVKLIAMWPQKPPGRLIEDGLENLKEQAIGDKPRHDHAAVVVCSAMESAMYRGLRAWSLCQAYKTISGIPDKASVEMFRSAGILSKDPAFMPSDSLWADVAMLSYGTNRSRYNIATDVMDDAYPKLIAAEQSFREWLSDKSLLEATAPGTALSQYDIPDKPCAAVETHAVQTVETR